MLRPLCKHDPDNPQAGCIGCQLWHDPGPRGEDYRGIIAQRNGVAKTAIKRVLPESKPVSKNGPGTMFAAIVSSIGFKQFQGCSCESIKNEMDRGGSEWCRKHLDPLSERIKTNAASIGWMRKLKAGLTAAFSGEWYNPLNPIPSMILEACKRSDECNAT